MSTTNTDTGVEVNTTTTDVTTSNEKSMSAFYEKCRQHYLKYSDLDTKQQCMMAWYLIADEFETYGVATSIAQNMDMATSPLSTTSVVTTPCSKCKKEAWADNDDKRHHFRIDNGELKNPARFEWLDICAECVKIEAERVIWDTCSVCGCHTDGSLKIEDKTGCPDCIVKCINNRKVELMVDPDRSIGTPAKRKLDVEESDPIDNQEPIDVDDEFAGLPPSFQTPVKSPENSTQTSSSIKPAKKRRRNSVFQKKN